MRAIDESDAWTMVVERWQSCWRDGGLANQGARKSEFVVDVHMHF